MPPEKKIKEDDLRNMYIKKRMSAKEIGEVLNCHEQTVLNHMSKFGIHKRRNSPRMKQSIKIPNKIQLSYIAGIIDGEGTISTGSSKNNLAGFAPILSVKNTDKGLIMWFISIMGGGFSHYTPKVKHWKIAYMWYVHKTLDVYLLLKAVEPYLIIKKEDAKAIIEICDERLGFGETMIRPKTIQKRYLSSERTSNNSGKRN